MIPYYLLLGLGTVLTALFSFLPRVTVLPWGIDGWLSSGVGMFDSIVQGFPLFGTVMQAFLLYLGFRLTLKVLKLVMGSRTPQHD